MHKKPIKKNKQYIKKKLKKTKNVSSKEIKVCIELITPIFKEKLKRDINKIKKVNKLKKIGKYTYLFIKCIKKRIYKQIVRLINSMGSHDHQDNHIISWNAQDAPNNIPKRLNNKQ